MIRRFYSVSSFPMKRQPIRPLIAVVGATGTGKSELAVALAKRYNGEIINGDAMQLYAGLPIITNKITPDEQQGMPHHLLGCIGLNEQTWVVGTFVQRALKVIDEIRARGKLPILVGGTHYYTQSLLFHDRLADVDEDNTAEVDVDDHDDFPQLDRPTNELLAELQRVDPIMAERWHPNDRRKIQRSLQIYLKTGRKASEIYAKQRLRKAPAENTEESPQTRFPTLIFWVHAETETLRTRLDNRVDKMLASGLLSEVAQLHAHHTTSTASGQPIDETRGIWVSIGYKELKAYTAALHASPPTPAEELEKLKAEGLERTKIATRQYAKRQIRWIKIKLLAALSEAKASESLYLLDGTDIPSFKPNVIDPALDIAGKFLSPSENGGEMPKPTDLSSAAAEMLVLKKEDFGAAPEKWTKQHCALCEVTCVTPEQWAMHVKSRRHRRGASKKKQEEEGGRWNGKEMVKDEGDRAPGGEER